MEMQKKLVNTKLKSKDNRISSTSGIRQQVLDEIIDAAKNEFYQMFCDLRREVETTWL